MALYKAIETDSGIILSYWAISEFNIKRLEKRVDITVVPYVSQEVREMGKPPVIVESKKIHIKDYDYMGTDYEEMTRLDYSMHFSPELIENSTDDIYKMLYSYLKTTDFFSGATDC